MIIFLGTFDNLFKKIKICVPQYWVIYTSHIPKCETLNVCKMPLIPRMLKLYPRSPCFLSLGLCALSAPCQCSSSGVQSWSRGSRLLPASCLVQEWDSCKKNVQEV